MDGDLEKSSALVTCVPQEARPFHDLNSPNGRYSLYQQLVLGRYSFTNEDTNCKQIVHEQTLRWLVSRWNSNIEIWMEAREESTDTRPSLYTSEIIIDVSDRPDYIRHTVDSNIRRRAVILYLNLLENCQLALSH